MNRKFLILILQIVAALAVRAAAQVNGNADQAALEAERPAYFDGPVTDDEFRLTMDEETARRAEQLIFELSDPEFAVREKAQEDLIQIGASAMSMLRDAYHDAEDLETRLRIEQVAHSAYVNHHVLDKHGFLGISMSAYDPENFQEGTLRIRQNNRTVPFSGARPRLPEGRVGVFVSQVIENTGAERAGVLPGDTIIAMNGVPVEKTGTGNDQGVSIRNAYSARIRAKKPGEAVELTIVRGDQTIVLTPTLTRAPQDSLRNIIVISSLYNEADQRFEEWWKNFFLPEADSKPDGRPAD